MPSISFILVLTDFLDHILQVLPNNGLLVLKTFLFEELIQSLLVHALVNEVQQLEVPHELVNAGVELLKIPSDYEVSEEIQILQLHLNLTVALLLAFIDDHKDLLERLLKRVLFVEQVLQVADVVSFLEAVSLSEGELHELEVNAGP